MVVLGGNVVLVVLVVVAVVVVLVVLVVVGFLGVVLMRMEYGLAVVGRVGVKMRDFFATVLGENTKGVPEFFRTGEDQVVVISAVLFRIGPAVEETLPS